MPQWAPVGLMCPLWRAQGIVKAEDWEALRHAQMLPRYAVRLKLPAGGNIFRSVVMPKLLPDEAEPRRVGADALCCVRSIMDGGAIVFSQWEARPVNLEERMKKRRADLKAAIVRAPRKFTSELLIIYRGWGSDVADYFLKSLSVAVLNADEQMNVARKIATERLGHGIPKLQGWALSVCRCRYVARLL